MAKAKAATAGAAASSSNGLWDRLKGKTVRIDGANKYEFGQRDRILTLARAHGASLATAITSKVDYVVVPDASSMAKGLKSKVTGLNAKGATIRVMDADDFLKLVAPTEEEVAHVIRRGKDGQKLYREGVHEWRSGIGVKPVRTISGQSFAGLDLTTYDFELTAFDNCDFTGAKLKYAEFAIATNCKFDKASGEDTTFGDLTGSTFRDAKIKGPNFTVQIGDVDFTGADLTAASFDQYTWRRKKGKMPGLVFRKVTLKEATFSDDCEMVAPDFESADLSGASWYGNTMDDANFRKANLAGANLAGAKVRNADFSGAKLQNAVFVDADLTGAKFDAADLTGANLRGAKTAGVDFSKAKGYQAEAQVSVTTVGPALKELDQAVGKAKRIKFSFKLAKPIPGSNSYRPDEISGDSASLRWGGGVDVPIHVPSPTRGSRTKRKMSDELLAASRAVGSIQIRFETLDVKTTKSKVKANDLRDVLTRALCEAFAQQPPDTEKLAGAAKKHRAAARKVKENQTAKWRKQREKWAKQEAAAKQKAAAKLEQKVAQAVGGKVTDLPSFLKALEVRADKEKIKKATSMLKAERFQLFNDITADHMSGVVKSQTDPDLVYACRIQNDGHYACCTQNLNICGGLRGSVCKHLLVLIIGLVKAQQLDPATIDGWVGKTQAQKPVLDKEKMGEIFVRYKGAEAGEIDWRPTETVPEDYYAL